MAKIDFAWELGAGTGHVTTLLPIAAAMQARGHDVRFLLRELSAGADLDGAHRIPREGAPIWSGPPTCAIPLNLGEILLNFGYHDAPQHKALVDAWRERLQGSQAVIANVAPAAHLAARTLGIPSFEISQGFHVPPPGMPSAPLRHWEPAPRARLEAADRQVLRVINTVLVDYAAAPIATIGELFSGRSMLLTYPELDIYPERGPSDYYGITDSGEGKAVPDWPAGDGPKLFAYLYSYFNGLDPLLAAIAALEFPTLAFCRGIDAKLVEKYRGGPIRFSDEPMAVSRLLPQSDIVVCHGSHQMTAQALLAGKPVLLLPTQLEQFLIMRRIVRYGAGLGIAPEVPNADFRAALTRLRDGADFASKAREFSHRYAGHDRGAALETMVARIEAALGAGFARGGSIG
jgi:UDP:flavonoid glycosyltransferase YjiC (YdhE family)